MQVKVLKKTTNELEIDVEGAGHTLCNLLAKKLLEDESVELAGYNVPHPLASSTVIYVRMKGRANAEKALLRALEKACNMNDRFGKELEAAFKKT
jgi:DNA-directed RNA polymerase subunit L